MASYHVGTCRLCGAEWRRPRKGRQPQTYCSPKCSGEAQRGKRMAPTATRRHTSCQMCGRWYDAPRLAAYCSGYCRRKAWRWRQADRSTMTPYGRACSDVARTRILLRFARQRRTDAAALLRAARAGRARRGYPPRPVPVAEAVALLDETRRAVAKYEAEHAAACERAATFSE